MHLVCWTLKKTLKLPYLVSYMDLQNAEITTHTLQNKELLCTVKTLYPVTIVIENCTVKNVMNAKKPSPAQPWVRLKWVEICPLNVTKAASVEMVKYIESKWTIKLMSYTHRCWLCKWKQKNKQGFHNFVKNKNKLSDGKAMLCSFDVEKTMFQLKCSCHPAGCRNCRHFLTDQMHEKFTFILSTLSYK